MKTASPPATSVLDQVTTWPGQQPPKTPRGSTAIVFKGHELGHVHPDRGTLTCLSPTTDARRS
jgi:Luciferase